MGINFPNTPALDQLHPVPAIPGIPQYKWNGEVWVAQPSTTAQYVQITGDTMTGPLSLEDAPTQPLHATNKQYVDANASSADKVNRSGDTMEGSLNLLGGNRVIYEATNTGFFIDTVGGPNRVFLGTWGAVDAFAILTNVHGEVMKLDVPTGIINFTLGGTVPNVATGSSTKIANTEYVERRASEWALAYANQKVAKAGDTMTGNLVTASNINIIAYGAGTGAIEVFSPYSNASISFHMSGQFGGNFGMASNGNMYFGGWSHGGVAYQLWSNRDFSAPMTNVRFAYVGDYQYTAGLVEGYGPSACVTGLSGYQQGPYGRHRQCQVLVGGGWYNAGSA